jgi:hypothetical protein
MSVQIEIDPERMRSVTAPPNVIVLDTKVPGTVIWHLAGGKGGTGKSTLTANMGVGLALLAYRVIIVDGDLGGADIHLFFDQVSPPKSLTYFPHTGSRHLAGGAAADTERESAHHLLWQ